MGMIDNFRQAIEQSSGDYMAFLGADNLMRRDYVERCKAGLDPNPKRLSPNTDMTIFGALSRVLAAKVDAEACQRPDVFHWRFPDPTPEVLAQFEKHNFIHGSSMYRRSVYDSVGGYTRDASDPRIRTLDIGCGDGFLTFQLPGKHVVGVELSERRSTGRGKLQACARTASAFRFSPGDFSIIVLEAEPGWVVTCHHPDVLTDVHRRSSGRIVPSDKWDCSALTARPRCERFERDLRGRRKRRGSGPFLLKNRRVFRAFKACSLRLRGGGQLLPTVEHYFQAQKLSGPENAAYRERIRNAKTPKDAKTLGRTREMPIRSDWDEIRDEVMLEALRKKYELRELRELLLGTELRPLIEASPSDYYWGSGRSGTGRNRLGQLLMQVRAEAPQRGLKSTPRRSTQEDARAPRGLQARFLLKRRPGSRAIGDLVAAACGTLEPFYNSRALERLGGTRFVRAPEAREIHRLIPIP